MTPPNPDPLASGDGPGPALDVLGPVWPSTQMAAVGTAFQDPAGWLHCRASGIGEVVGRLHRRARTRAGCHPSSRRGLVSRLNGAAGSRREVPGFHAQAAGLLAARRSFSQSRPRYEGEAVPTSWSSREANRLAQIAAPLCTRQRQPWVLGGATSRFGRCSLLPS